MLDKAAYYDGTDGISISHFFGIEVACWHETCVGGFLIFVVYQVRVWAPHQPLVLKDQPSIPNTNSRSDFDSNDDTKIPTASELASPYDF
jgi:hypothetical protein